MDSITSNDIVYISGPMSGIVDANRQAFADAEISIKNKYGCRVLNPMHMPDGLDYRHYMVHALALLSNATAIALLPGHEDSVGAMIELKCAQKDGLKIVNLQKDNITNETFHI